MSIKFRFSQQEIQQNPYKSQSLTFISHKYPNKEKNLGKLLILLSFDDSVDNDKFERFLTELENIYYQSATDDSYLSIKQLEQIFEQSLKKFNQQFTWLCQSKHLNIDFKKINILVAVIRDNNLLFSQVNRMDLFITYMSKENNLKIINIAEPADSRTPLPSSMKLFANLISGDLQTTDTLLITNKNLSKYLSLYKLKNLLLYPNARQVNQEITKNLRQITNSENFAWLLTKREEMLESEMEEYQNNLTDEAKTETEPSADNKKQKESAGQFWTNTKQKVEKWRQSLNKEPKKQSLKKNLFDETIEVNFGSKMKKMLTALPFGPSSKGTSQYALPWHQKFKKWFKDLITYPWFIRFGLVFLLIAIIGFTYSAFYLHNEKEMELAQKAYDDKVFALKSDVANARARLMYGDKEGTETAYQELLQKIDDLSKEPLLLDDDKNYFNNEANSLYNDLYNIIEIKDWNLISDLESFVVDNIKYERFAFLDKNLISYGGKTKLMLKSNLSNGQSEFIDNTSDLIESLDLAVSLEDDYENLFFWTKNKEILQWNASNNLLEKLEVLLPEDMSASAVAAYGKNLYFLDPNNKQIQKFTRTSSGFSKGKPWIMDADLPNLNNATDIAIDSNIYVLYQDGRIERYFSGKKDGSFDLNKVTPAVERADRLITNENINYLYVIDKKAKRIVVLDKNGVFQKQYQLNIEAEIQDINIKDQSIYILSENKIWEKGL